LFRSGFFCNYFGRFFLFCFIFFLENANFHFERKSEQESFFIVCTTRALVGFVLFFVFCYSKKGLLTHCALSQKTKKHKQNRRSLFLFFQARIFCIVL